MNSKNIGKKGMFTAMMALAMLAGVVGGTTVFNAVQANAQTAAVQPSAQTVTTPPAITNPSTGDSINKGSPSGKFVPNEDPAHEAQESPQREAQENAGQFPTVK